LAATTGGSSSFAGRWASGLPRSCHQALPPGRAASGTGPHGLRAMSLVGDEE
jgi:hypothetical protein